MSDDVKPITIILTIHPPKKTMRKVDVAAAPEGELPLLLTGDFANRHKLADQAFAALLKRKPKVVKVGNGKAKAKKGKAAAAGDESEAAEAVGQSPEAESGPIGPVAEAVEEEALPVIEGDEELTSTPPRKN